MPWEHKEQVEKFVSSAAELPKKREIWEKSTWFWGYHPCLFLFLCRVHSIFLSEQNTLEWFDLANKAFQKEKNKRNTIANSFLIQQREV